MITFHPYSPFWLIVLSFGLVTVFLLWSEWNRKLRFRTGRLVAVLIMMLMLAAILLRPHSIVTKSKHILLLTHGYNGDTIDSLMNTHRDLQIVRTNDAEPYQGSRSLNSYFEITDLEGNIDFVAGEGLPGYALDLLHEKNFTFIPGKRPVGIVDLSISEPVTVNRKNELKGRFRNESGKQWIFLVGPGGKEDSAAITATGVSPFTLSFTPRQTGKLLYTLSVMKEGGSDRDEMFPVIVNEFSPLNVLVVLSFPTYETTFLKNFLSSRGNKLVLRSQLSKNNFSYEYVNHDALRFSTLNKALLDEFDLLIADQTTLQNLSNQESTTLKQSIQNGLGLLPIYDGTPNEKTSNPLFPFRTVSVKGDTTTVSGRSKRHTLPVLPFRVVNQTPLQVLSRNESGILSGYTLMGKGKIGFQLVQQTFRLMLAGDTIAYGDLWSPALERIARSHNESVSLEFENSFPFYVDEPIRLRLISSTTSPTLMADSVRIPLREDILLDDVWHATAWPSTPGWHSLLSDDRQSNYYVSPAGEWGSMAIENQMQKNGLVNRQRIEASEGTKDEQLIPQIWFYILFLLSAGFLWLAPKL